MPSPDKKVSILLNGGVDNRSLDELVGPLAKQGDGPTLKKSINTRLGVTPGGVTRSAAATSISAQSVPDRARAIVSAASGKNTLVIPGPDVLGIATYIPDAGRAGVTAGFPGRVEDRSYQSSVFAASIAASTNIGSKAVSQFAMSYNATRAVLWYAWLANDGYTGATPQDVLMVGSVTSDGVSTGSPTFAAHLTAPANRWVGVTSHGSNGDRVWYISDSLNICYRTLSLSGGLIIVGSEVAVIAPGNVTSGIDVCRLDDTFAALVHPRLLTPADGSVSKVNITTGGISSVNITNALQGGGDCAVAVASPEGAVRIATAFASTTAGTAVARVYDSSLALISTSGAKTCNGRVAVGFNHNDTASSGSIVAHVSLAVEQIGNWSGLVVRYEPSVAHFLIKSTDGSDVYVSGDLLPWYRIAGRAAQWVTSGQLICTVHQLAPRNASTNESPGQDNYCDDPSLDLYWCRADGQFYPLACFARLGTVRGTASPFDHLYTDKFASSSLMCVGDDLHSMYRLLTDFSAVSNTATRGRRTVVRLSASAGQLTTAQDRDGCGLLAAALPLQWDGQSVAELGAPVHTPQFYADVVTSGGTVLTAGTYSYQAVIYWADASGLVHRSRPSKLRTVTLNGTTERVGLSVGHVRTMMPTAFEARIYATEVNGKSLHLMAVLPVRTSAVWFATFATAVTAANAQIYSGGGIGEEITPQPPPPAWDISIIGQRCWIVDAEMRSRAVYSKLRVAGIGYEFTPAFEIILPSGAGSMMACREWQGLTIVLTERAVYQVAGDGPSNTLGDNGGSFSPPVKIADIGCTNTASVVVCPSGILWQFGSRFVILDGSGVHYIPGFQCTHDVSAAVCLARFSEVLLFSGTTTEVRVYNYESGSWTTWDAQTLPELVRGAHVLPHDPDAVLLCLGSGPTTFRRLDANSVSTAGNMTWETDWLLLGGDFQDCILLRDVIFNGQLAGPHDIKIELFTDYSATVGTSRTWTATQLDAIDTNGYYTVRLEPTERSCRAVKIRVTETLGSGAGCSPRSLTVVYAVDGLLREESFVTGSRQ
jgi:hypothetical protein